MDVICTLVDEIKAFYCVYFIYLVALMQKVKGTNRHYCMTAEGLQMEQGKKLWSYVGSCCQYPKIILTTDGKIFDERRSVCIEARSVPIRNKDVQFTESRKQNPYNDSLLCL